MQQSGSETRFMGGKMQIPTMQSKRLKSELINEAMLCATASTSTRGDLAGIKGVKEPSI